MNTSMLRSLAMIVLLAGIIVIAIFGTYALEKKADEAAQQKQQLQVELQQLKIENASLKRQVSELRWRQEEILQRMERWLDAWEVELWEATAYAPLDPAAVDGWDYCTDPNVTASGQAVEIGVTAAAGPSVPFGTRVYIPGFGFRVVQDRGSRITDSSIDIAIESRAEALRLGRKTKKVVLER